VRSFRAGNQPQELRRLAADIERAANTPDDRVALQFLAALPDRPMDGLYLFAANVTGPGNPRGVYVYDSSTGSYTNI
jgi:hypothetical protein